MYYWTHTQFIPENGGKKQGQDTMLDALQLYSLYPTGSVERQKAGIELHTQIHPFLYCTCRLGYITNI